MDGKEVRAMKNEELVVELKRLRAHLFKLRGQSVTEKVEDNSQFAKTRRDIARLLTEQTARVHGKSAEGKGAPRAAAKPSGRRRTKGAKPAETKKPAPKKHKRAPHAKKKVEKKAPVKRAGARSTKKKAAGKAAKGKA
jgi:ribosomal protein L29